MIDCFIERMTVLGRGLVFQPVLVTHICTYNSNNIITLQSIDITDFLSKKQKNKKKKCTYRPHLLPIPPPPPQAHNYNNIRSHDTSECFDMSLQLSKLHIKKDKNQNQMTNINRIFLTINNAKICA